MGSASYLAAGLVRGLCPSQAMPGPWCSISAPLLPDTLQSMGLAAAYWGHLYPQGKGTDRDSSRLSATFGLVVGGREVSDPHNPPKIPIGGVSVPRSWHPSLQPGMCCSLFIAASLPSEPH